MTMVFDFQKIVLKLGTDDEKSKRKALQAIAGVEGKFHNSRGFDIARKKIIFID
jgi:hypothetical protein